MNCRYGDIKEGSAVDTGAILILSIGILILFFIVHADKTITQTAIRPVYIQPGGSR